MTPNIVIIVLDAARAQNLPFYGYDRNTTPFLCSIKDDLTIYENAVSSTYWTMPSITSLLTGTYTSTHGLLSDGDKLSQKLNTLPSMLKRHGYRTAGFVKNIYVSEYSGLNRGYDEFITEYGWDRAKRALSFFSKKLVNRLQPRGITRSADPADDRMSCGKDLASVIARCFDVVIDRGSGRFSREFGSWLKKNKSGPFFAYFHIFETHSPYRSPFGFALKYLSLRDNLKKLTVNQDHLGFLLGRCCMEAEDFRILRAACDNSIRYADHIIKRIFGLLKANGVLEDTMVVILADHGDNIGEHEMMFHYFCLYDTLIKIPLMIKYPKRVRLEKKPEVVQNTDIYPTVLSLLDIRDSALWRQAEGNDLLGRVPPRREQGIAVSELIKVFGPDRVRYKTQLKRFDRRLLSLRTGERKFIFSSRGDHEYYDLAKDPGELNNLYGFDNGASELKEKASIYYEKMDRFYMENREKFDGNIDPDRIDSSVAEKLKSLGYM